MKRRYLMTPGPSPVPAFVREALSEEIIHHRTDEFRAILKEVNEGLRYVFCTQNPVLVLASSGTGAMEAAVSNLFSGGDKIITISGGKFGERWKEIGVNFGLEIIEVKVEWGKPPAAEDLEKILAENKDVKGVLTTLCETSTATTYDIEAIGKLTKGKTTLLVVDAISGLGQDKFMPDEWGVDVVVSGSQKGFMLPPGISLISLNEKAKKALERSDLPKYYFDLQKALKSYDKCDTPFTPAVSLIVGLRRSIEAIKEEGIENRWAKFEKMGFLAREAAAALGLKLLSERPSSSVTAIIVPEGIKATDIVKRMRKQYGLSIAAGQGDFKDKIIRIAHMGWINEHDLIVCFSLLEKVLKDLGYKFEPGISLSRLQDAL